MTSERVELRQAIHEPGQGKFGLGQAQFLRQFMFYSNVSSVAALRLLSSGHALCVGNVHVYSNQLRPSVQVAQMHVTLHRLAAAADRARTALRTTPATLVLGDFNATPTSPLLRSTSISSLHLPPSPSTSFSPISLGTCGRAICPLKTRP
jgi:endonuclease/exonuclease/phosphatase family metal-dependent hydrolase